MKKIIAAVCICLVLGGCSFAEVETTKGEKEQSQSMFVQVEKWKYWQIVYHRETKVMYVVSNGSDHGAFTLLVNPDGTPKLYNDVNSTEEGGA